MNVHNSYCQFTLVHRGFDFSLQNLTCDKLIRNYWIIFIKITACSVTTKCWQSLRVDQLGVFKFHNLGVSEIIFWRRSLQMFFTSSIPRTVSSAGSFSQRSVSWRSMVPLSFNRTQITNGNPKRCLYSSLNRAMRDVSPGPSASRPAAACSSRDSGVRVPRCRSLPARSG